MKYLLQKGFYYYKSKQIFQKYLVDFPNLSRTGHFWQIFINYNIAHYFYYEPLILIIFGDKLGSRLV